jgi:hypothetical protein
MLVKLPAKFKLSKFKLKQNLIMFEKSVIFSTMYSDLTILGDLLQTKKAKLPYPSDKFKTCEGFFLPYSYLEYLYRCWPESHAL